MRVTVLHKANSIITVHDAASADECAALIAFAEHTGFADAPITTATGFVMAKDIRNNDRVMIDDGARASAIWDRLASAIPQRERYQAVGLNERLRFYRYQVGQQFAWHRDGAYERPDGARSQLTLMIYLNDDFEGGATEFDVGERIVVKPERGMALLFAHPIRHQGATVTRGQKYVLRSDVMFRRITG